MGMKVLMSMIDQLLSLVVVVLVLLAMLSIVYKSWRNGISPMPSSAKVRYVAVRELKRLSRHGTLVEAGSGWGTLALQLGRSLSGVRIIGIENSVIPLWFSIAAARMNGLRNVSFIKDDLYDYSYTDADTVVCYLYPGAMKRLSPILREQLKSGSYIMSLCFALPGWEPVRVITCSDVYRTRVYVYQA